MSTQLKYKENNFSAGNFDNSDYKNHNNLNLVERPNIEHLIKRIHDERKKEKKNFKLFGFACLLTILIFYFLLN